MSWGPHGGGASAVVALRTELIADITDLMKKTGARVGILGGGQLARMIAHAAARMGVDLIVFAQPDEPATQVCSKIYSGSLSDQKALHGFFRELDLVIFENEFIPCDLLEKAAAGTEVSFAPGLGAMRFLQDKLNQKSALAKLAIPSARFIARTTEDAADWLQVVLRRFPKGAILKWARMGYDGKGTFFLSGETDFEKALVFCNEAHVRGLPLYAEEKIPFRHELAIVACLSSSGDFTSYPLSISEQENGVCLRVRGPARAFGIAPRLETQARRYAESLARSLELHGTFALEFFETRTGKLLVNEIAPRVHNTGHYTLDASETDQFENHLRAVLGLPLGSTRTEGAYTMLNLLGPETLRGRIPSSAIPAAGPRSHLHWYGKREIAAGRKMGHLNGSAESIAKLRTVSAELEATLHAWRQHVLKGSR